MGKMSRTKGRRWEQDLVRDLKKIFGEQVKRSLVQTREGDSVESDVCGVPGWWIEAKAHHRVNIHKAMRQARAGAIKGMAMPAVISKNDYEEPLATLRMRDFFWLLEAWWKAQTAPLKPEEPPK